MPHYMKSFDGRFLGAWDAEGGDLVLTIQRLGIEALDRRNGQTENCPVLFFGETKKGLVLNKTNAKCIASMFGDDTDGWTGKTIRVYRAQVEMAGSQVWALRVRLEVAAPPAAKKGRK